MQCMSPSRSACCGWGRALCLLLDAAAAVAAAASATAAAVAAAATAAAAPIAARSRRLRLVHCERPAVEHLAVQLLDRLRRVRVLEHLNEAEAAGAPGITVDRDAGRTDRADLLEERAQALVCRVVRQTAYIKLFRQGIPPPAAGRRLRAENLPLKHYPPGRGEKVRYGDSASIAPSLRSPHGGPQDEKPAAVAN